MVHLYGSTGIIDSVTCARMSASENLMDFLHVGFAQVCYVQSKAFQSVPAPVFEEVFCQLTSLPLESST